ncbi:hypothetical protein EB796_020392 [Bugula neritina]|uniref:Uncharacterized protein n=1 Tax=Bugula neritina TaxID=10212 RepID=A0A7J7J527_BUGNE|nr:hypothetical protein EB796_020392 [Bugula neritina]
MKQTEQSDAKPSMLNKDILKFKDWKTDSEVFPKPKNITGMRQPHLLKKYVGGEARKCINVSLTSNNVEEYGAARNYLKQRYNIKKTAPSRQFKKKLLDWLRISPHNNYGLHKFADFLTHRKCAVRSFTHWKRLKKPNQNLVLMDKNHRMAQVEILDYSVKKTPESLI